MEAEDLLSCSQEPATGPYPEPDESNPQLTITLLYDSILTLSSHLDGGS